MAVEGPGLETQRRDLSRQIGDMREEGDQHLSQLIDLLHEEIDRRFNGLEALLQVRVEALDQLAQERVLTVTKELETRGRDLDRRTREGDEALLRHINAQVVQVKTALDANNKTVDMALQVAQRETELRFQSVKAELANSARLLDVLAGERARENRTSEANLDRRFNDVEQQMLDRLSSVRDQLLATASASKEAVAKAETATERRLEGLNEFRASLADQAKELMPREVADTQFSELRTRIATFSSRLDLMSGSDQGKSEARQTSDSTRTFVIGGLLVLAAFLTIFVTVALATHGFK